MAGFRCPGSDTIATTSVPPLTALSWARAGAKPRTQTTARDSTASTIMGLRRIEPLCSSPVDGTCCEESKRAGQKKGGGTGSLLPRLPAAEKIVQHAAELTATSRQRVLDPGRRLGMHRPLDQSRFLEVRQSCGQRGRADVPEPASELVEPDRPMVGDETKQPEGIAPTDQFRQRRGRAETVG